MTTEVMVTVKHLRAAKFCTRGARQWFAMHGLDFTHFLMHGYPVSVIEGTKDAMGRLVAQLARDEAEEN